MVLNLNEEKFRIIIDIKYLYGLNQDAEKLLEEFFHSVETDDSNHLQKCLVEFVLNDEKLTKFKPSCKYRKSFLKKIISVLEKKNEEINAEIYDSYIQVINDPECSSSKHDQKYFISYFSKVSIV
jgi:hypothetical protein